MIGRRFAPTRWLAMTGQGGLAGSAPPEVLALIEGRMAPFRQRRAEAVVRAAARLSEPASG